MINSDTNQKLIRFTDEKSLLDNPSEILRAAYSAAKLDFRVAPEAYAMMRVHRKELARLSSSEIRYELFSIFSLSQSIIAIRIIDDVGVLSVLIPEIDKIRNVKQNQYHHLDVWEHSLLALEEYEKSPVPEFLSDYSDEITDYLNTRVVYDKRKFQVIKYALLMHDIGKAKTRRVDKKGWISFMEHEKVGADIAESVAMRLRFGGKIAKMTSVLIRNHLRTMLLNRCKKVTQRAIRRLIKDTKKDWIGVLLLSYFDLLASQGPLRTQKEIKTTEELIRKITDFYFKKLKTEITMDRLISASDLREKFQISSELICRTIKYVEDCQFNGEIHTKNEALKVAERFLEDVKMQHEKSLHDYQR